MRKNKEIADAFHITCSQISKIMAGTMGLTEAQEKEFNVLKARHADKTAKPLTEKMIKRADDLYDIQKSPVLPSGAQTYCLDWLKQQPEFFNRRPNYSNKYTEKGIIVEDSSLDFVKEQLKIEFLVKNEHRSISNCGRVTGIPDNIQPYYTLDVKNSWSWETFPTFVAKLDAQYEWQGQGQMLITERGKHKTIYILSDTPTHLIEREASIQSNKWGYDYEEILESLLEEMTYSDIDPERKIKVFEVEADPIRQQAIFDRVDECRKFIFETLEAI